VRADRPLAAACASRFARGVAHAIGRVGGLALFAAVLLLQACAGPAPSSAPSSTSPAAGPGRAPAPVAPPAAAASARAPESVATPAPVRPGTALELERRWLQSWFEGTPVRIQAEADGLLSVEVPRHFCFDPARQAVKPALAVVLDKVAEILRRQPRARVSQLAAPGDAAAGSGDAADQRLAQARGEQVRNQLRARRVAVVRLAAAEVAATDVVRLLLEFPGP